MENNFTHLIYNIQFPVSSVPGVNGHMTVNTHQLAAHTEPVLNFSIKPNNTIETSIPQPRAVTAVAAPATLHLEQPHPVQHTQAVLPSHANINTDTWQSSALLTLSCRWVDISTWTPPHRIGCISL